MKLDLIFSEMLMQIASEIKLAFFFSSHHFIRMHVVSMQTWILYVN